MSSLEKDIEKTKLPTEAPMEFGDAKASATIVYEGRNKSCTLNTQPGHNSLMGGNKKSWADMVQEDEQESLSGRTDFVEDLFQESSFPFQTGRNVFNDENLDSNVTKAISAATRSHRNVKQKGADIFHGGWIQYIQSRQSFFIIVCKCCVLQCSKYNGAKGMRFCFVGEPKSYEEKQAAGFPRHNRFCASVSAYHRIVA